MPPWQFVQSVQGINAGGVVVSTSKAAKTAVAGWDAGARATPTLSADGFVEMKVDATGKYRAFGLSAAGATPVHVNSIGRGFYLKGGGTPTEFGVLELGSERLTGVYAVGDVFRVQRVAGVVTYWKNGELVYTSSILGPLNGAAQSDLAIFDQNANVPALRAYDATLLSWPALAWTTTNCTVTPDAPASARRITFAAPTKMRAGDQIVVILAGQGTEFVSATNVTWDFLNTFESATNKRGVAIYRRIVTDSEPLTYTFDLNATQETLGGLIVFRSLDNSTAWVGGSGVDFTAVTLFPMPSRTMTRYSDLYLGIVLQKPSGSVDGSPPGSLGTLLNFSQSALGVNTLRLYATALCVERVGATDVKNASSLAAQAGMAASVALQGLIAPGQGLTWTPLAAGAIGLPAEGI